MENTNKPQWLIDAERDINEFAKTKYGKLTDKEFKRNENASYAASFVKRESCVNGAKSKTENEKNKYGKDYNKVIKSRLYDNLRDKSEFHKKGNAVSSANRTKKVYEANIIIINDLPEVFTVPSVADILIKHGRRPGYVTNIIDRHPEMFEILEKGKKGYTYTVYRKINPETNS